MIQGNKIALTQEMVEGAKLFANRYELIKGLNLKRNGIITEIGVALGDFSDFLIKTLEPKKFIAMDLFDMHNYPVHWGTPQEILFKNKTHYDFYFERFKNYNSKVQLERGLSYECLSKMPDSFFDLIYIDANHSYNEVLQEALVALKKIKPDGIIIFNDYIMYDHFLKCDYGVVQVANEILIDHNWKVIGFAFERNMFCDIAIACK